MLGCDENKQQNINPFIYTYLVGQSNNSSMFGTGCSEKYVGFFQNSLHASLAYIAVKDLQSSQRNSSVQSLLLAGNFLYHNI